MRWRRPTRLGRRAQSGRTPAAPAARALAHEFNNALAVIINYSAFVTAELESLGGAAADPARQSMRADLCEIQAAAERALELSRRMMDHS